MSGSPQTASIWGWRGAASGVVERLKKLLDTGERSDVQFAVGREHGEEQLFRAHRLVLGSGSDVFDGMFYGEVPESTEKAIELPDILPQAFAAMLKYLYTDVIEDLNLENVLSTLYCAKKYGIPKLVTICSEYALKNVDKDTCLGMLEAAKVLDAGNLVDRCLEIVDGNCTDLLQSEGFLRLKNETVREIFIRDTLIVNEEEVYKAAQRWAISTCLSNELQPTPANYRLVLGDALFLVQFPLMDDEQLANGPVDNEEIVKIYQFKYAAKKHDIPFSSIPRSSEIAFCDRRWIILDQPESSDRGRPMTTTGNVFRDQHGHLHLRLSQHDGIWKGADVRLVGALGFGRCEFHIEGLDRLHRDSHFVVLAEPDPADNLMGLGINFIKGRTSGGTYLGFLVLHDNCIGPSSAGSARDLHFIEGGTITTHSFHRQPNSVSFSSQRGHQRSNTAGELCSWLYDSGPSIPKTSL